MNAIICLFAASIALAMLRVALFLAERIGMAPGATINATGHGLCNVLAWGIVAGLCISFVSLDASVGAWTYIAAPFAAFVYEAAKLWRRRVTGVDLQEPEPALLESRP